MKFNKGDFTYEGGYLMYKGDAGRFTETYGDNAHPSRVGTRRDKIIARFKHVPGNKSHFLKFLINNFEVQEYFELAENMTPIQILETKGYVAKHIQKMLVQTGFEPTREGYELYLNNKVIA